MNRKEKERLLEKANNYFEAMTSICFTNDYSFKEYLSIGYNGSCSYYSAYALMGMNDNDKFIIGKVDYPECKNYEHRWMEFFYDGEWFVFDCKIDGVNLKKDYYQSFNPRVYYVFTKKELLNMYLSDKTSDLSIEGNIYKYTVRNVTDNDDPRHLTNVMSQSVIEVCNGRVKKFIGNTGPSA